MKYYGDHKKELCIVGHMHACNQLKSNWGFLAVDWTMADDDDGWEEMKEKVGPIYIQKMKIHL